MWGHGFFILNCDGNSMSNKINAIKQMNSSDYLRRKLKNRTTTIGFQNGQDSSLQTMKVQARATSVLGANAVATNQSKIGGSIGNIMDTNGVTNVPTEVCASGYASVSGNGQTGGYLIRDSTANRIIGAQGCAVCSDAPSSAPFNIVLPCVEPLEDVKNAPGNTVCCTKDMSQLFRDNTELIAEQGRQLSLRNSYNLPNKLQGLRGPVVRRQ
jgi:hypothetical protein